jgi:hypothetical protein
MKGPDRHAFLRSSARNTSRGNYRASRGTIGCRIDRHEAATDTRRRQLVEWSGHHHVGVKKMRVYAVTLAVPAGSKASGADAELIRDALWAHSRALGDVEHITVSVLPAGIGVAVFMNHLAEDPEEQVRALLRAASQQSPVMSRWRKAIESEASRHDSDDQVGGRGHGADPDPRPGCS